MRRILLSLGLFVLLCAPALAGNLFPPANATNDGSGFTCAPNTALVWSTENGGSLKCADTSKMVTIPNCPAGQVLTGINNGTPVCMNSPGVDIVCPSGDGTFQLTCGGRSAYYSPNFVCSGGKLIKIFFTWGHC